MSVKLDEPELTNTLQNTSYNFESLIGHVGKLFCAYDMRA